MDCLQRAGETPNSRLNARPTAATDQKPASLDANKPLGEGNRDVQLHAARVSSVNGSPGRHVIANILGSTLESLEVEVTGDVDLPGTLARKCGPSLATPYSLCS